MAPTKNVETPERHQDEVDHLLFIDPIAKKTTIAATAGMIPPKTANSMAVFAFKVCRYQSKEKNLTQRRQAA